ncbi:MAG: hypothetical protein WBF87_09665 [Mesorhizobium sp.]
MNIPLQRLIDGIIATMRSEVIPNVTDQFARGQAVGVIDLLNNIAPRVEWAQAPLAARIEQKRALLAQVERLLPASASEPDDGRLPATAEGLIELKGRLDAAIGDAITLLWPRRAEPEIATALDLIKTHLHDEMATELKTTRKPLFAEIASGGDGARS